MQMGFVLTLSQFHGILDSLEIPVVTSSIIVIHLHCFYFPKVNFMKPLFSKLSPRMNMNH